MARMTGGGASGACYQGGRDDAAAVAWFWLTFELCPYYLRQMGHKRRSSLPGLAPAAHLSGEVEVCQADDRAHAAAMQAIGHLPELDRDGRVALLEELLAQLGNGEDPDDLLSAILEIEPPPGADDAPIERRGIPFDSKTDRRWPGFDEATHRRSRSKRHPGQAARGKKGR